MVSEESMQMVHRRRLLFMLMTSPLFLYFRSYGNQISPHALSLQEPGFIIINGWVLLNQDLIEYPTNHAD